MKLEGGFLGMSEMDRQELVIKAADLIYRVFEGKKTTHSEIIEKANQLLPIIAPSISSDSPEYKSLLEAAIDLFEQEVGIKVFDPNIIDKEYDKELWLYKIKANIPHPYIDRYKLYLRKEGFANAVIEKSIIPTCEKILSRCVNPRSNSKQKPMRGLVVGDVQSGKTANYLALANMAFDYGYKIVVLLAGTTESLRVQTQKRVDVGIIGANSNTIGDEIKYFGVGEYNKEHYVVPFTNQDNDFAKFIQKNLNAEISDFKKPVILVVKKNKNILESVNKQLKSALKDFDSSSILIIDDEADNASISTAPIGQDPTTINRCIREIFNKFPIASYVGFTATPFANIFINPTDDNEHFLDLFPADFIIQLRAPENYFGGYKVFPHEDTEEYPRPLRLISEKENDFLPVIHKKDAEYFALADSLKEAIGSFLINCVVRTNRGHQTKHRSMMINITRYNDVQDRVYDRVLAYVDKLKNIIEQSSYMPVEKFIKNEEMEKLHRLYTTTSFYASVRNGLDFDGNETYEKLSWDTIQAGLYDEISRFEVVTVNSRNGKMNSKKEGKKQRFDYELYGETGARVIAIGGLVLSRGLTLEGLMVSYFSRNAGAYDTLLQMCRWFGYRPKYDDLCRVYISQDNIDSFSAVLAAVDDLKNQFREMEQNRRKPEKFGLMVREKPDTLETTLLITARNKLRNSEEIIYQLNYGGVYADTSKLLKDEDINKHNYSVFKDFYNKFQFSDVNGRYMVQNVWKHDVASFISKLKIHYCNKKFDVQGLSEYIADSDVFEYWDVVIATGESTLFSNFIGKRKAATRSFRISGDGDKFIRIGGVNNRVLDPGILDSGLAKGKIDEALDNINAEREKNGEKAKKYLSATDYLKIRETPVLVIYPIELLTEVSDEEVKARFGSCSAELRKKLVDEKQSVLKKFSDIPLMAFAVAFPDKESSKRFRYRANLQKIKELTENLEVNDEDEGEGDNDD